MNETTLSRKVLLYLNSLPNCKAIKIHGSRYQEAGTPDIMACLAGQTIFIELKVGKNKTTKLQDKRIEQWKAAGAAAFVAYSLEEVKSNPIVSPHDLP